MVWIGIAVVLAVVATVVVAAVRRGGRGGMAAAPIVASRPPLAGFHVKGNRALVSFDVPLPSGGDAVLADLLTHEAIEVVREKRHTLPIDGVREVVALARRDGSFVEVGTHVLDRPGVLPEPRTPDLLPRFATVPFDPVAALPTSGLEHAPGLAEPSRDADIGPAGTDLHLTARLESALRSQGVDPSSASSGEVVLAVLSLTGNTLQQRPDGSYLAAGPSGSIFVQVIDHEAGGYPEIDEAHIDGFLISFAASGASRGLCVSDKYCPFLVYEKERRQPRVRFVTRERLQGFVDALGVLPAS